MRITQFTIISLAAMTINLEVCLASSSYHFDGPRQAEAIVSETPTLFTIETSQIPVTTFDPSTNDQLNRSKLRQVAIMALARHLNVPPTSELNLSEFQTMGLRSDLSRVIAGFDVPKSVVKVTPRTTAATNITADLAMQTISTSTGPLHSALLTRKGDYLDTVLQLQEVLADTIADVSLSEVTDEIRVLLEQGISGQFSELRSSVDGDLLLLSIEREDIYAAIEAAQQTLTAQLDKVQKISKITTPSVVTSMYVDEPFGMYLKADPLILQYGGARMIVMPKSNDIILVSVASAAVRDNSGADRIRMEKVCHQKALAGLLAEKQGLQVKYALVASVTTTTIFDDGREQTASLETMLETTTAQVEGFVRDLPVVGSWYSADGQLFFLAIGGVRSRTSNVETQE